MTPEAIKRRNLIIQSNGCPNAQKDDLVSTIINVFRDPEAWPMTDSERCELLRRLYRRADFIRQTEAAIKETEAQ